MACPVEIEGFLGSEMHGCPCGFLGDPKRECACTYLQIQRYRSKISGPLLDRIDIHMEVPPLQFKDLAVGEGGETLQSRKYR